ncbi:hypothetical protein FRC07_015031 [Ceratobasidium sp. 392]|nr:hypothetical protein FRC07_015031 [Ceratobasidium sp. 392]
MALSDSTPSYLSDYQRILNQDYGIQRILDLCDLLNRVFPSDFEIYPMPDQIPIYSNRGVRAPTEAELNTAGALYLPDHGSNAPGSYPTPLCPRALTGTLNDNPRATKRCGNNQARNDSPLRANVSSDNAFDAIPAVRGWLNHLLHQVNGHTQDHAPETHPYRHDNSTNSNSLNATNDLRGHVNTSTRPTYGHSQSRATLKSIYPATPTPAATHGQTTLPSLRSLGIPFAPRLPPIVSAATTPTPSVVSPIHTHRVLVPQPPTRALLAAHAPTLLAVPTPLTQAAQRVTQTADASKVCAPTVTSTSKPSNTIALALLDPKHLGSQRSTPIRIPSPGLGAAYTAHAMHSPMLPDPSFQWMDYDSSPPGFTEIFGPSPRRLEAERQDAMLDEDDGDYEEGELELVEMENDGPEPDGHYEWTLGNDYVSWKALHPRKLYPSGPPCVSEPIRIALLQEGRIGKYQELWEEGMTIQYYRYKIRPNLGICGALRPPTYQGKNPRYHITFKELREVHFLNARCNAINFIEYDFNRIYNTLKTLNAWRYICYSRGGELSWMNTLHFHGTISPPPACIGAPNAGSRSGCATAQDIAPGSAPKTPAPNAPALKKKSKGKGKTQAPLKVPMNAAIEGSDSSLPSAPLSYAASDISSISNSGSGSGSRTSAPTDVCSVSQGNLLSVPRKSVAARTGNWVLSSAPETRDDDETNETSQPMPAEIICKSQASKHELNKGVLTIRKEAEQGKLALLEREQEKSEEFRAQKHDLAVAHLELEQQSQLQGLLFQVLDRGREVAGADAHNSASRILQDMLESGASCLHGSSAPAVSRSTSVVPSHSPMVTPLELLSLSRITRSTPRPSTSASSVRLPPLQIPAAVGFASSPCTSDTSLIDRIDHSQVPDQHVFVLIRLMMIMTVL